MSKRSRFPFGSRVRGTYGIVHISKALPNCLGTIQGRWEDNRGCIKVHWDSGLRGLVWVGFLEPAEDTADVANEAP